MKKIVRQQNYLKELIEGQANRLLSFQALSCLVKSTLEPLLDSPEEGAVLYRINAPEKLGMKGLLKRLEFSSEIDSIDYSDDAGNLIEKVWANTEFICVMTHRYVAIIIWETNVSTLNFVKYYSLYNSKLQYEPLDIIKRNSKIDITSYAEKFNPDRRDNILLNSSIRKLLQNLEESTSDAVLGYAEQNAGTLANNDYIDKKSRVLAHELRNQLSICDLHTEIIKKYSEKDEINKENVKKSLNTISKALKLANNSLLSLKLGDKIHLNEISLKDALENAIELSKVYLEEKDVDFLTEIDENVVVNIDAEKFSAIIINLVKNAAEAFDLTDDVNGKYVKIKTEKEAENHVLISISNNAHGIKEPQKVFDEGYTTKSFGSGLGLWICKKYIESMGGELKLERSSEDFTEFTIRL